MVIGYRYYSAFLAARVWALDNSRKTPAHTMTDGHNYHPTNHWVLFGHHFAAISGAGPLIGPVLAAQFGYLPGLLWLLIGVVLGGAVQDFFVLVASVRHGGRSLAEIAKEEISSLSGVTAAIAILFIIVIALAGLGLVVVNALSESSWGTFAIFASIPIALFMGIYMYRIRPGRITEATIIGVVCLVAAVVFGVYIPMSPLAPFFTLSKHGVTVAMAAYGFIASVLPVWLLLCPRDYLSSYMKIGTVALLFLGVLLVNPALKMPAITMFVHGGGPVIPGKVFPFVFITIMCGAISGFHALVASGTTPKMINCETDCRSIGYGCMLMEGLVGIIALIAAASLLPGDYFAINVPPDKYAQAMAPLGYSIQQLPMLSKEVGESLVGRTGGAVTLAVGMAKIFSGIPGMGGLMKYWYHFAILFEALFILTTIDTGTRIARFLVQEFMGRVKKEWGRTDWMPGTIISSALIVLAWGYLIWGGSIMTIWPMFGIANQLLAVVALAVVTTILIKSDRIRYVWATLLPMAFVTTTTLTAGVEMVIGPFWKQAHDPATASTGWMDLILTTVLVVAVVVILVDTISKWFQIVASKRQTPAPTIAEAA
jgi:carbon starvation protein